MPSKRKSSRYAGSKIIVVVFSTLILLQILVLYPILWHFNGEKERIIIDTIKSSLSKDSDSTGQEISKPLPKEKKRVIIHEEQDGTILILTPIKDASKDLSKYFDRLEQLEYSKEMISLGFIVGSSTDHTYQTLLRILEERNLRQIYRRITVVERAELRNKLSTEERHSQRFQNERRIYIAMDRNYLLNVALQDEQYVFWLDHDVELIPSNIMETMIKASKPIVVANCMFKPSKYSGNPRSYDLNSWVDTPLSRKKAKELQNDHLLVEGYENVQTFRTQLQTLRRMIDKDDLDYVVELNGVGGTALMVKAEVHRNGIIFPTFVIDNAIETEGLCRIAERNGLKCYGMPNLEVWHPA